ncbi:MAG: phytanoyl-CoA hydroxylase [Kiritimatiellia bacterium]|jgi:phytanoyl-CoA hydroxylase
MPNTIDIDEQQLQHYARDGFVRIGKVLDGSEIDALHAWLDELRERNDTGDYGLIVHNAWRQQPLVESIITSEALTSAARALTGQPRVRLFQDNLVWKLPGSARIEWHQDYSYQPLDGPQSVTLWLCLDHATPESGCMHYIPGTHLLGERLAADFIAGTGQPKRDDLPTLDWRARQDDVVAMRAEPGELLAHHPLVWHMSPKNRSPHHRRAFAVNWIGERVRWKPSQAPHPFNYELGLVDGDDICGQQFPLFPAE